MTLNIPPEYESQLRRASELAGYADVQQYILDRLLPEANGSADLKPRTGGQWKGQVVIADDFDELPLELQVAFGIIDADESVD